MYASDDTISARVGLAPRDNANQAHIGKVLEGMGFRRATVDTVILWEQDVRHERTSTSYIRRVSHLGNGHYNAFIVVEGSTPTTIGAMAELGDTPEERLRRYLQHNLEGFVMEVLAHYFEIQDRYS